MPVVSSEERPARKGTVALKKGDSPIFGLTLSGSYRAACRQPVYHLRAQVCRLSQGGVAMFRSLFGAVLGTLIAAVAWAKDKDNLPQGVPPVMAVAHVHGNKLTVKRPMLEVRE